MNKFKYMVVFVLPLLLSLFAEMLAGYFIQGKVFSYLVREG
ncbi:MAG: hypothetical protein OEY36_03830 [Gammaproteobacteria bacterium]|nr:hypothetical protein [Gammaproteobacteria bacterium]